MRVALALQAAVPLSRVWCDELDDQVRGAFDPTVSEDLLAITPDEHNIGLDEIAVAKQHVDRTGYDEAELVILLDLSIERGKERPRNRLVEEGWSAA